MIDSTKLLKDLQRRVRLLEDDLRQRCNAAPEVDAPLRSQYEEARQHQRTALTYQAWRDEELTQIAVAWVLACVFIRFLEDNHLVETPHLAGPGDRLRRARDEHELFFRRNPTATEREFLLEVFAKIARLPAMKELFDRKHNPLWMAAPSGDACRDLWQFWQRTDPESGNLLHDFTDPGWNTRFLGDLYQDLSEAARKRYALLQTPDFVEEFILDRTLTPAIETFGYREVRLIDPTCGSGHFLLGAFHRLFKIWFDENTGENPRVLAQRALNAVHGVDLNPFAVAIARFRLILAALKACNTTRLENAPDFELHLAAGDSLIHGARFDSDGKPYTFERQDMFNTEEIFKDETAHFFNAEDREKLHKILGQQYHAVVGNPPYISVKDKNLKHLYKSRFSSCYGKWVLSIPFMERFFDLSISSKLSHQHPGFTGQITSNSFMKREFGKKIIEEHIPKWELTHIIDSSGAYIPGHGTPTVIIFGRNHKTNKTTIKTVMGLKGEPSTPQNPSQGLVWKSIEYLIDKKGESEFISSSDLPSVLFYRHPWSIGGTKTIETKKNIEAVKSTSLNIKNISIGITSVTGEDDLYIFENQSTHKRHSIENNYTLIIGDQVRDWSTKYGFATLWPYNPQFDLIKTEFIPHSHKLLWRCKKIIEKRKNFGTPILEKGLQWYDWQELYSNKLTTPLSITFAFVATHNHFVLDRGGKVFKQSAPVIKLPAGSTVEDHLELLGLLNSSTACFWMKQVFHNKGDSTDSKGARKTAIDLFANTYEFDGTKLKQFPVPSEKPLDLAEELDRLAGEMSGWVPSAMAERHEVSGEVLSRARGEWEGLRRRMISLQEELDWECYRIYGLVEAEDRLSWPVDRWGGLPAIGLGERAFEIRLARQMAAGEVETAWFDRHAEAGSRPTEDIPSHWPEEYRGLVQRRLDCIEKNKNIHLIERPEYKRRWNTDPWEKQQSEALRQWLLTRLEGYFFEGERVCDLKAGGGRVAGGVELDQLHESAVPRRPEFAVPSFDPATLGLVAATRPQLVSVSRLADVVAADRRFLEAAEVYVGSSGFSVAKLVRELVESESVPFLPTHRYQDSGLRKRRDWESTWELQRQEDAIEAQVRRDHPDSDEDQLKNLIRKAQKETPGDIPVPPKYTSKDFLKTSYWRLRGKLDVPRERWIVYPGAEEAGSDSPVIAWAGWNHLQQAQALAEYFLDAQENQGWPTARLVPLLAGLADLQPWLLQWHNEMDPNYGMGLGDYFSAFLEEKCRSLGLTRDQVDMARFDADAVNHPTEH